MRYIIFLLLFATPAMAQNGGQQVIDGGIATVARVVTGFGNEIASLVNQVQVLQKQNADKDTQIAALTKERDDLKKTAKPAK